MKNIASMKKMMISMIILGFCVASSQDSWNDAPLASSAPAPTKPDPRNWEDDAEYQEYKRGNFYLKGQYLLFDENGKGLYNAGNGKPLRGPNGDTIRDWQGNPVWTGKDQDDLYDAHGNAKWGPKNGGVYYGPNCVPLKDHKGCWVYGPCYTLPQYVPHKPKTNNPTPQPHPTHPGNPLPVEVPFVPLKPRPDFVPIPLPRPEAVPVRPPTPVEIPRPVWAQWYNNPVPVYVPKTPQLPRLNLLPSRPIAIPRAIPGYTPRRIPIVPPGPVPIPHPVPFGTCLHLYFPGGRPFWGPGYGKQIRGVKDRQGNDVWGSAGWPDLVVGGKPTLDDKNGSPLLGPDGELLRLSYPNGAVVYGPKLFYKEYPGDGVNPPVVVGSFVDEDGNEYDDSDIVEN